MRAAFVNPPTRFSFMPKISALPSRAIRAASCRVTRLSSTLTVIACDADNSIATEEVFGPVLSVISFDNDDDAIAIANGTDYGLVAGVFTRDLDRATTAAAKIHAGQVFVNEWYAGGVETPFGGYGKSGYGREKGREALWNYVQTKNIAVRRR